MPDFLSPKELLLLQVHWRKIHDGQWHGLVNGRDCYLHLNNFPEEPLYTVSVGDRSLDVEDAPHAWTIE